MNNKTDKKVALTAFVVLICCWLEIYPPMLTTILYGILIYGGFGYLAIRGWQIFTKESEKGEPEE